MKYFSLLAILVLVVATNGFELFKAGQPKKLGKSRTGRVAQLITAVCNDVAKSNKRYCNGEVGNEVCDATGYFQCNEAGTSGSPFLCGGTFKHCNEATPGAAQCLPDPSPLCAAEPSDFICTGEGVFPDPSDCKSYFFCTKDPTGSLIAENLFCDDLYVFDPSGPKNNFCRLTVNRYCTTANCAGAFKNILLSYAFFPKSMGQLVASCQGDSPAIVTRCEAGFEANLSSLPVECNLVCTGAKKEAHPTDETKYYECVYVGSRWESKVKSCFSTYYFNATKKQCEVKPTTTPAPATVAPASA